MTRRISIDSNGKISFGGEKTPLKLPWTTGAERDLMRLHGVDLFAEIIQALLSELEFLFSLTQRERELAAEDLSRILRD